MDGDLIAYIMISANSPSAGGARPTHTNRRGRRQQTAERRIENSRAPVAAPPAARSWSVQVGLLHLDKRAQEEGGTQKSSDY